MGGSDISIKIKKILALFFILVLSTVSQIFAQDNGVIKLSSKMIKDINNGRNVYIENSTIIGNLDFSSIQENVSSKIHFVNSLVEGNVNANSKIFESDVMFNHCIFKSKVVFSDSTFNKKIIFISSSFSEKVLLSVVCFKMNATFSSTIFDKEV